MQILVSSRWFVLMFPRNETRRLLPLMTALVMSVGLNAGCQKAGAPSEEAEARMRKLLYPLCDYSEATKNGDRKGPPNDEGFKAYLASLSKQKLADLQITNAQDLFVSPRDQKPFVINYGIPLSGGSVPAIWEQTGVNGRRCVLYVDGKVEEVDDETFSKIRAKLRK